MRARRALAGAALVALLGPAAPLRAADPAGPAGGGSTLNDPWEGFNRPIFAFNDFLARNAFEPVGRGWAWLVPTVVRESISRAFVNVRTPGVMVNDLLQGKPRDAGIDLLRILLNTSIGIGGLLDPAAHCGFPPHDEDFGQTFGVWGIPPGPYLVLPFFGPSSPRDAVGRAADAAAVPYAWLSLPIYATLGIGATDQVNDFSFSYEDIAAERKAAFDWYAAVRNAWVSRREALVRDKATVASPQQEEQEQELYLPEEELEQ